MPITATRDGVGPVTAVRATLWWAAALAAVLLLGSLTGGGNGLFGSGWFAAPGWIYVVLGGVVGALMVAQARSHARAAASPRRAAREEWNESDPPAVRAR